MPIGQGVLMIEEVKGALQFTLVQPCVMDCKETTHYIKIKHRG
jgi:hypothetical protein